MRPKIGVATTGGDAPGMNACLRAIVKRARTMEVEVVGIKDGALGLLRNAPSDFVPLSSDDVSAIVDESGTMLRTTRDRQVFEYLSSLESVRALNLRPADLLGRPEGKALLADLARAALNGHAIHGLILIGGDTTCRAARAISSAYSGSLPIAVVPATIDNDVSGTTQTLGFESAVAAAVRAIDAVRASALSHSRIFIIEVMGRNHGYIALETALSCGAEEVLIPEIRTGPGEIAALADRLAARRTEGQYSALIIVAEGVEPEGWGAPAELRRQPAFALKHEMERAIPDWEVRVVILGHTQRGAEPTPYTRTLAARLGSRALDIVSDVIFANRRADPMLVGVSGRDSIRVVPIENDMIRPAEPEIMETYELIRRLAY